MVASTASSMSEQDDPRGEGQQAGTRPRHPGREHHTGGRFDRKDNSLERTPLAEL